MFKLLKVLLIVQLIFTAHLWADGSSIHSLGYVVVSPGGPDDGGAFGPNTPGTQTSGIQEAFDYAKANNQEVFIVGGGMTGIGASPVVYDLSTTLTIPWGQDWHCDGGNYVMNFTQTTGDCLIIDSQMNCVLRFGNISAPNLTSGSIVKIAPTSAGPDGLTVCRGLSLDINRIVGGGNPLGGTVGTGTGLELNTSAGGINFNKIKVGEIVGCQTAVLLNGSYHNKIECPSIVACNTGLQVIDSSYSDITALFKAGGVAGTVFGANLAAGQQNHYTLTWLDSFPAGNAMVFGSGAQDNLIIAMNLPVTGITNNAVLPTNRIVPLKSAGFDIATPSVPASGVSFVNDTCYSVVITIVTAGSVANWTVTDAQGTSSTVTGAIFAGQSIFLEPGDAISMQYSSAPTWLWRAMR